MEERTKKQTNSSNIMLLTIGIIALVIVCIGGTYAYFTATATSNTQTVTTGTLTTNYTAGADINATNIIPTEETEAQLHTFTIENTGSKSAALTIKLIETTLTKESAATTSANLKWALYEATDANYTLAADATALSNGDFTTVETTQTIAQDITIDASGEKYFVLKIWLQETGAPQNEDQGISLSTKVQVEMQ